MKRRRDGTIIPRDNSSGFQQPPSHFSRYTSDFIDRLCRERSSRFSDSLLTGQDESSVESALESILNAPENPEVILHNGSLYDLRHLNPRPRSIRSGAESVLESLPSPDELPPKRRRIARSAETGIGTSHLFLRCDQAVQVVASQRHIGLRTDPPTVAPPPLLTNHGVNTAQLVVAHVPTPPTPKVVSDSEESSAATIRELKAVIEKMKVKERERRKLEKSDSKIGGIPLASFDDSLPDFYGILARRESYRRRLPSPPAVLAAELDEDEMTFEQWKQSIFRKEMTLGGRKSQSAVGQLESESDDEDSLSNLDELGDDLLGGRKLRQAKRKRKGKRRIRKRKRKKKKKKKRRKKVPAGSSVGSEEFVLDEEEEDEEKDDQRRPRLCLFCKKPVKGHPRLGTRGQRGPGRVFHAGDEIPEGMVLRGDPDRVARARAGTVRSSSDSSEESEMENVLEGSSPTTDQQGNLDLFEENVLRDPIEEKRRMLSFTESDQAEETRRSVRIELESAAAIPCDACSICLASLTQKETFALFCQHVFHLECINDSLTSYNTQKRCPKCDVAVRVDEIAKIGSLVAARDRSKRAGSREMKKVLQQFQ